MSVTAGRGDGCRPEVPSNVGQKFPGRGLGNPPVSRRSRALAANAAVFLAARRVSPQNPHPGPGAGAAAGRGARGSASAAVARWRKGPVL